MTENLKGDNLIFLISQPRSGSTLLQKIVGGHPEIFTLSEPWIMLHPFYALKKEGYIAQYDSRPANRALRSFLEELPDKEDDYVAGVRRMYSYLYDRALEKSGKKLFLDKTPRYYFVIPELLRTFPNARFVILLRNPLSVLLSVIDAWVLEDWFLLARHKHDLIDAPQLLLDGVEILKERAIPVHYEKLVANPEIEIEKLCERLGIDFNPQMIEYDQNDLKQWSFGDKVGVHKHSRPVKQQVERWIKALEDPWFWRLAYDYLKVLGDETIEKMGYSPDELKKVLDNAKPSDNSLRYTVSLSWLLKNPKDDRKGFERILLRLIWSLHKRGYGGTARLLLGKLFRGQS